MGADPLLDVELTGVDGNAENRKGTVSLFNGPAPEIRVYGSPDSGTVAVVQWLGERIKESCQPCDTGVFTPARVPN